MAPANPPETNRAAALAQESVRFLTLGSISPMNSTPGPSMSGSISLRKYSSSTLSTLAAIFQRDAVAARAILIARSGRFSGEIRPRKAKVALPCSNEGRCRSGGMPWCIVAT